MPKALTVQSIDRVKPDRTRRLEIPDGLLPGLYFVVQPTGSRSWAVRYRTAGKPRKYTLGPYPALDLAAARSGAREVLQAVAVGRDPAAEKRLSRGVSVDPERDQVASVVELFLDRHVGTRETSDPPHSTWLFIATTSSPACSSGAACSP